MGFREIVLIAVQFAHTLSMTLSTAPPQLKLYTHTACPFAQRVQIALEQAAIPFEKVDVNLYGSGGFDKSALKKIETAGGLSPKGYIPVIKIGSEVIRESSVCVERVAALSNEVSGAVSLTPELPQIANELIALCNGPLARDGKACVQSGRDGSPALTDCLRRIDAACEASNYLAGSSFSTADVSTPASHSWLGLP